MQQAQRSNRSVIGSVIESVRSQINNIRERIQDFRNNDDQTRSVPELIRNRRRRRAGIALSARNQYPSNAEMMVVMGGGIMKTEPREQVDYQEERYQSEYFQKQERIPSTPRHKYKRDQIETCPNCQERRKLEQIFACQHKCCSTCYLKQVNFDLKRFEITRCLHGCGSTIRKDQLVLAALSAPDQKKYKRIRQFREAEGEGFKLCPICQDDVGILIIKDGLKQNSVSCARCDKRFCRKCLLIEHEGICDNQMSLWLEQGLNMAVCPNEQCQKVIQLGTGCNHMTCKCKTQFCYKCEQLWGPNHACPAKNRKQRRIQQFKKRKQLNPQQYDKLIKKQQKQKIERQQQRKRDEERKKLEELQKKRKQQQQKKRKQEQKKKKQQEQKRKIQQNKKQIISKQKYQIKKKNEEAYNAERQQKQIILISYYNWLYNEIAGDNIAKKCALFVPFVLGQIFISLTLAVCIILNAVLSWLIMLPIREIVLILHIDFKAKICSLKFFLLIIPTLLLTIIIYALYLLFVPTSLTYFTSKLHLFDIKSILIGQLPIILQINKKIQDRTILNKIQIHQYCDQDIKLHCTCCRQYRQSKFMSSTLMFFCQLWCQ